MNNYTTYDDVRAVGSKKFLGVVFGYAAVAFLITAAVAFLTSYLFINVWQIATNPDLYLGVIIAASITQLIVILWISFGVMRRGKSITIPFIIYALVMGVLLSSLTMTFDWVLMGTTFALTCVVFGMMALVGFFSKSNLSSLLIVGMGLMIGSIGLAFINFFFWNETIYWIITFVSFGAIMLITAFDMWRIRQIMNQGAMTKNIALYCAFSIYVDFIYIFIRIAIILSRVRR